MDAGPRLATDAPSKSTGPRAAPSSSKRAPAVWLRLLRWLLGDMTGNLFALLVFCCLRHSALVYTRVPFVSCDDDQPLLQKTEAFASTVLLDQLNDGVRSALSAHRGQALSASFEGTFGFVLKFSEAGIQQLRSHSVFGFLAGYLDAARDEAANAFVMNVLVIPPLSEQAALARDGPAVGWHVDNTVGIEGARAAVRDVLAHSVSVLYLQWPAWGRGGALELCSPARCHRRLDPEHPPEPNVRLTPTVNTLAVFRGDALHRVTSFYHDDDAGGKDDEGASTAYSAELHASCRVSLVLEQYRVPRSHHASLTVFELDVSGKYSKSELDPERLTSLLLAVFHQLSASFAMLLPVYWSAQFMRKPASQGLYGAPIAVQLSTEMLGTYVLGDD